MLIKTNSEKFEKTACPVCSAHSGLTKTVKPYGYQYGIDLKFYYCFCKSCGALFQNPRIKPNYIGDYYLTNYYTKTFTEKRNKLVKFLQQINFYRKVHFDYRFLKRKGKILDYGAGSGAYLSNLHQIGWKDLWGYDPDPKEFVCSPGTVQRITESDLFPLSKEYVSFFEYIYSFHSIEHIHNPKEIASLWYKMLMPGGKLIISTPNISSLNFTIFGKYWYFLTAPLHYVLYNSNALECLLKNAGFKIDSIENHSNFQCFWGSIDLLLHDKIEKKDTSAKMLLNNNKILEIVSFPIAFLLDLIKKGDNLVIFASKN